METFNEFLLGKLYIDLMMYINLSALSSYLFRSLMAKVVFAMAFMSAATQQKNTRCLNKYLNIEPPGTDCRYPAHNRTTARQPATPTTTTTTIYTATTGIWPSTSRYSIIDRFPRISKYKIVLLDLRSPKIGLTKLALIILFLF